ncbi:inorganic phosphate transporter [Halococcoides cellulosivorans]|uniref:Phosphate transporter n=1 Tax=Halococcoides cellulosivorans TaxID=1679096 RepID=A0A2R4X0L2_9EURY|nr:inorganic phosphate transporter [Halococcoides cellulosivorans]AWB27338.1 anion permease [Halococcoides cellulosivorans]
MVVGSGVVTLVIAAIASAFMAWSIGAGSSGSTPFAPAVGANAITTLRAGLLVGLIGFAGAVLQGANVSEAVGRELIGGVTLSPVAATIALVIAGGLVAIGVFTGYPIATAFTVTGAVVGTGLAMGGAPAWDKYLQIGALWVLVPILGGTAAYALGRVLKDRLVPARVAVPLLAAVVWAIVVNMQFALLGPAGEGRSTVGAIAANLDGGTAAVGVSTLLFALGAGVLVYWRIQGDPAATNREFLLVLGALVAFSAGGTQVGLAIGPLVPLLDPYGIPLVAVLVGGGLGLLIGSWTGAPRMIKALSQDYSSLDPDLSIAALIPSFAIAQVAVFFGIPVSFNEIIVSAIVGAGFASTGSAVSREKAVNTVGAWVGSLVLSLVVSFGAYSAVAAVLV